MMVFVRFLVVVAAAVLSLFIVMMVFVRFLVVVAAAVLFFLIMMVMMLVVVMVLVFLFHCLKEFSLEIDGVLQNLKKLFTGERRKRRRDDGCLLIDLANQSNRLIDFLLIGNIRAREHNGLCVLHLVVEELAEVLHVELRLLHIDEGDRRVARDFKLLLDIRNRAQHIRELTDAGGLDNHAIRCILAQNFLQRGRKITDQRAADATGVHLPHFDAGVLQKAAVNADFAELVFNEHDLLSRESLREQFFNKCGLSRTEKAGNNIYLGLCHDNPPFLVLSLIELVKHNTYISHFLVSCCLYTCRQMPQYLGGKQSDDRSCDNARKQ